MNYWKSSILIQKVVNDGGALKLFFDSKLDAEGGNLSETFLQKSIESRKSWNLEKLLNYVMYGE